VLPEQIGKQTRIVEMKLERVFRNYLRNTFRPRCERHTGNPETR
jgi:hypothetical protein